MNKWIVALLASALLLAAVPAASASLPRTGTYGESGPTPCNGKGSSASSTGRYTTSKASVQANCVIDGRYEGVVYAHLGTRDCGAPQPNCPNTSQADSDSACTTCYTAPWSRTQMLYASVWDATSGWSVVDSDAYAQL